MDTHKFVVREISAQVKSFYASGQPFQVYHGPTHTTRPNHAHGAVVNASALSHVLDINFDSRFAIVEPNVPMDQLVKEALKHGLIPPVVPAFPGTTIGGTFAGTAASSSSFKYGFFDRSVSWLELVLADGRITRASTTHNPGLLLGTAGSLATLGITTLFQITLVVAAPYVELTYKPVNSATEAVNVFDKSSGELTTDFVEGLIFGEAAPTYGVVCVGKLAAEKQYSECRFSRARDPWFYAQVQKAEGRTETVPLIDYLFRYDRGSFCMGRHCFGRIPLNKYTRWLADTALHSRNLAQTIRSLDWAEYLQKNQCSLSAGSVRRS